MATRTTTQVRQDLASERKGLEHAATTLRTESVNVAKKVGLAAAAVAAAAITAKVVADTPGTTALATASHSVAAAYGYPDGEQIPRDLMVEAVGRIAAAVDLPVTADLEAGYGDPVGTARAAWDGRALGPVAVRDARARKRRVLRSVP